MSEDLEYWMQALESDLIGLRSRIIRLEDTATVFQKTIMSELQKIISCLEAKTMNKTVKIHALPLPELCQDCGQKLLRMAEKPDGPEVAIYCPHNHVLAAVRPIPAIRLIL